MDYVLKAPIIFEKVKQLDCFYLPTTSFKRGDRVVFDLSGVKFIKPPGVMGILNTIEYLERIEPSLLKVMIYPPQNEFVLEYLVRVDFIKALEMFGNWKIPDEDRQTLGTRLSPLIPLQRFSTAMEVERIAQLMEHTFHTELLGFSTLLQPCHVIFSELADNVLHHAGSNGGFVLAQQYNYRGGPILEIAVGDCGIGVLASLSRKQSLTRQLGSDKDAIALALEDGISCIEDSHRGYGLGHVRHEVARVDDRILTIRSGSGYIINRGSGYKFAEVCKPTPGTIVHTVIPCGR